jgi:hypothetical protein
MERITLEIIENNKTIIKNYKSLSELHRDYPKIPYHNLRYIYLENKKEKSTKFRKANGILNDKFKIYDNVDYINRFTQTEKPDDVQPEVVV